MSLQSIIPAINTDGSLYPIEKLQAHTDALFHLAVSVFVFDGEAVLIQRRAMSKYHCGGLWANTCCTHPDWGEELEKCAPRRLREEMGIDLALTRGGEIEYSADVGNGLHEHERVTIFCGKADRERIELTPDTNEVMDWRWISPEALRAELRSDSSRFTPWLLIYMKHHSGLIFGS